MCLRSRLLALLMAGLGDFGAEAYSMECPLLAKADAPIFKSVCLSPQG